MPLHLDNFVRYYIVQIIQNISFLFCVLLSHQPDELSSIHRHYRCGISLSTAHYAI